MHARRTGTYHRTVATAHPVRHPSQPWAAGHLGGLPGMVPPPGHRRHPGLHLPPAGPRRWRALAHRPSPGQPGSGRSPRQAGQGEPSALVPTAPGYRRRTLHLRRRPRRRGGPLGARSLWPLLAQATEVMYVYTCTHNRRMDPPRVRAKGAIGGFTARSLGLQAADGLSRFHYWLATTEKSWLG
jgi:hypothetical protein